METPTIISTHAVLALFVIFLIYRIKKIGKEYEKKDAIIKKYEDHQNLLVAAIEKGFIKTELIEDLQKNNAEKAVSNDPLTSAQVKEINSNKELIVILKKYGVKKTTAENKAK